MGKQEGIATSSMTSTKSLIPLLLNTSLASVDIKSLDFGTMIFFEFPNMYVEFGVML